LPRGFALMPHHADHKASHRERDGVVAPIGYGSMRMADCAETILLLCAAP